MDSILLIELIERMTVAATIAFILSQMPLFRRIIYRNIIFKEKIALALIFGFIGILGTYAGIPVNDALANSRAIGVISAGLVGGRVMGVSAGIIAGGHRYLLGGFTAFSCALANICEGLVAGWVHKLYPQKPIPWWVALITGIIGEIVQMGIILLTARPYDMAVELVQQIAMPMIVANSLGIAIFMLIIKTVMYSQEMVGAEQSHKALDVATKTLPYLRHGLDSESGQAAAKIIFDSGGYDAVAVTNTEKVLAFVGAEAEHHSSDKIGLTKATYRVLANGKMYIAQSPEEIGCSCNGCRLASAIVVPLMRAEQIIGALKLYYTSPNAVGQADIMFVSGLAHLFSTQLELTEIDRQAKLAERAKMKALYAQINPHFFFNTLNTITSLVRTQPDLARELLLKLGAIFRYTLHKTGQDITIAEELAQVRAYLTIEKARYGEKLTIEEAISPGIDKYLIPSLSIQPLVENAIRHGLQPKESGGRILIKIGDCNNAIDITIEDDGVGMDWSRECPLETRAGGGIGLVNVHERIRGHYGPAYGVFIESYPGQGAKVTIRLPKRLSVDGEQHT